MKLKFTFIFFCLILSVISLNLKKKNENKKSLNGIRAFLKTNMGESSDCKKSSYKKYYQEDCKKDVQCVSNKCTNGKCEYPFKLIKEREYCDCDYHCETGHCSFFIWFFGNHYRCTKD